MGFIEFIRKDFLGRAAGWTFALKRFQFLELLIAWTMLWCRHGYLLVLFGCFFSLRACTKITSHFQRPIIPLSGVAKIRNMPDIPAFSRLAERAPGL
jgi:hypothetical protein